MSGEGREAKHSLSDLVLIKQLAKKNSHPPQVLHLAGLPGQAGGFSAKHGADLRPATLRVGPPSDGGCLLADLQSSTCTVIQDRLIWEPILVLP